MIMVITSNKNGEVYFADSFYEVTDVIEEITGDEELAEDIAYWFEDGDYESELPQDDRFSIELEEEESSFLAEVYYG